MKEYVFFVTLCILIPFFIGLYKIKVLPNYLKPILINLGMGIISEIVLYYLKKKYGNNIIGGNFFYLIDYVIMAYFFSGFEIMTQKQLKYFKVVSILLIGIWVLDNIVINTIFSRNYLYNISYSFVLVVCTILLFTTIIIKNSERIIRVPLFYITIGLLLYYTFDCFIKLLVSPLFDASIDLRRSTWIILSTIILFKYILFSIGFLWVKKK